MDPRRKTPRRLAAALAACMSLLGTPCPAEVATGFAPIDTLTLGPPDFVQPVAVAAAPLGRLFVADLGRGAVFRLNSAGHILFGFESPPDVPGILPLDLAVTGFQVYVLDAHSDALLRYTDQGSFLDVLQSFRDEGGETPRGVAVDRAGRVLLASPTRHTVRLVDETQRTESVIGGFGARTGELSRPSGVAFAPDGSFYVADTGNRRVQHFSGVGNFVSALADSSGEPHGLAVGPGGELYVADPRARAVHLFAPGGAWRADLRLEKLAPTDVAIVGDTLYVLSTEPAVLVRARVVRGE